MPQPALNTTTYPTGVPTTTPNTGKVYTAGSPIDSAGTRPYLHMRATAVYHHNNFVADGDKNIARDPIACVATFYDPTTKETARNRLNDFGGASLASDADFDFGDGATPFDDVSGFAARRPVVNPPNPVLTLGSIPTRATLVGDTDPNNDPNSLNGITYGPPTTPDTAQLDYQAGLFYPNGRRVNPLLEQARIKGYTSATLTLQEKAAVDTATCALDILNGSLTPTGTPTSGFSLPHGTIQEVSFLDARQIKSIEKDINTNPTNGYDPENNFDPAAGTPNFQGVTTLNTSNYDLSIELRQPLEIRATQINLDKLRQAPGGGGTPTEYMLAHSGIIYATREDALPDLTDADGLQASASDHKLDPTRRPNGILLVNGKELGREPSNNYVEAEKGLILASNLPVYVKGDFNLHDHEEFDTKLLPDWSNFYTRTDLNKNFACRKNDTRLPDCTQGDKWRPATVLADSVTLLSDNFRFGFRDEGDFDLRNNRIDNIADADNDGTTDIDNFQTIRNDRAKNGFWDNNFVTSRSFTDTNFSTPISATGDPTKYSSYFNNFVTPIQRRSGFAEYVMEMCPKLPVSECAASDWILAPGVTSATVIAGTAVTSLTSGTTKTAATNTAEQRFPRRVAFQRNGSGNLVLVGGRPVAWGVDSSSKVQLYSGTSVPSNKPGNTLWFKTIKSGAINWGKNNPLFIQNQAALTGATPDEHPLLEPVTQLQIATKNSPGDEASFLNLMSSSNNPVALTEWLPQAALNPSATGNEGTTFNMIMAVGDNPSRPPGASDDGDFNGGVANLPHFLENWKSNLTNNNSPTTPSKISGSFIQLKRSSYATAPFVTVPIIDDQDAYTRVADSRFGTKLSYRTGNSDGRVPYYEAPERQWGFDVGLLSQSPDLFSKEFAQSFSGEPNEYFREISRDDEWIETLLCGKPLTPAEDAIASTKAINDRIRPNGFCTAKTGG